MHDSSGSLEGFKPTSGMIDCINFQVRHLLYHPPPLVLSLCLAFIVKKAHMHDSSGSLEGFKPTSGMIDRINFQVRHL